MIPVLEEKSNNSWKAFGRGFADGLGSVGNLAVPRQRDRVRRYMLIKLVRSDWRTDWERIHRDFESAIGKLNERTDEK